MFPVLAQDSENSPMLACAVHRLIAPVVIMNIAVTSTTGQLFAERCWIDTILDIEAALATALAQHGVIESTAAAQIVTCCTADLIDANVLGDAPTAAWLEGLLHQLTACVAARDTDAGNYVHWGISDQDLIETAMVLRLRVALDTIETDLSRLIRLLAQYAERHRHTAQIGRIGLRHGLPITFGLKIAGWLDGLMRHEQRLQNLLPRLLVLQFGSSTGTLASLGEVALPVAFALAEALDLGLPDMPWHSQLDRFAEVATTLGLLAGSLGKMAHDMALLAQTEVAELAVPEGWVNVLAAAQQVPALVALMLANLLQEHEGSSVRALAHAEILPQIVQLSGLALEQMHRLAMAMAVDTERMQANLELSGGRNMAEPVALALARKIGRQRAETLVKLACEQAVLKNQPLRQVLEREGAVSQHLSPLELDRLLEPAACTGQSAHFVNRVLQTWRQRSGGAAVAVDMLVAETDKASLYYEVAGPLDAPWLILSNALGTSLDIWTPQMPVLVEHFRVLRYDARGHGQSAMPDGPPSIAQVGADVVGLMNQLGIARASFCGSSLGGMTGLWLATHQQARIERLVVANAASLLGPSSAWDSLITQVQLHGIASIQAEMIERWFTRDFEQHAAHQVNVVRDMLLRTSPAGFIAACTAIRDMDLRDSLPNINVPTLVIGGKRDRLTPPAQTRRLVAHINGARYVELNAGHLPNWEVAQRFNSEVTGFLLEGA